MLKRLLPLFVFWGFGLLLLGCDTDSSLTPSLQTEIMMVQTDAQGVVVALQTDDGLHYTLKNQVETIFTDSLFRCLCVYVDEGDYKVSVSQLKLVTMLSSIKGSMKQDPTGVQSVWLTPSYLNLHLYPKTKGGVQKWGYKKDSTLRNASGGTSYYLSLYHRQLNDTAAFSTHFYASVALDSIALQRTSKDSLFFSIVVAPDQSKTWELGF